MKRRCNGPRFARLAALLAAVAFAAPAWPAGTVQFAGEVFELWEGEERFLGVVRTGDTSGPVSVLLDADAASGTATRDVDFRVNLPTGVLDFADGETFKLVGITTLSDGTTEGTEHARLVLSSPLGAALGAQSGLRLLVRENETAVPDSAFDFATGTRTHTADTVLYLHFVLVGEGDPVTIDASHFPPTSAGTVDVTVIGGSATLGVDYVDPTATLSFAAGASIASFTLSTVEDSASEGLESIELLLANPTPPSTVPRFMRALVLIADDDAAPAGRLRLAHLSIADARLETLENLGPLTFRVMREGGASGVATVDYVALDGRHSIFGRRGYVPTAGTLTFGDGVAEQSFSVSLIDDAVVAFTDDLRVVLVNATGGAAVDPSASSVLVEVGDNESICDDCGIFPGGGSCFIATAAYGSYLDPHVAALREFRDRRLLTHAPGRAFVAWYYRVSPPLAQMIRRHAVLRVGARTVLTPVVFAIVHPLWTLVLLAAGGAAFAWLARAGASRVR